MVVVRKRGIHSCRSMLFKAGRNRQVTIYFFALHGLPGGGFVGKMPCDTESRYGRYISCDLPGCGSIVLIDNANRNVLHLSATENGCHEE